MKESWKKGLWTALILCVDVQPVGVSGTNIGLATVNGWFHRLTGVHLWIYTVTDWLVLSVMPTLVFQANRRVKSTTWRQITLILTALFTAFMVIGRLVAGVHWLTDIIGAILLSTGLYLLYRSTVILMDQKEMKGQSKK